MNNKFTRNLPRFSEIDIDSCLLATTAVIINLSTRVIVRGDESKLEPVWKIDNFFYS